MNQRTCLTCGESLTGRADKKFCSDQCRSTHNNQLHMESNRMVRSVNRILSRNRRILGQLNPGGQTRVSAQKLQQAGFDFRFVTSVRMMRGAATRFCYEHGYRAIKNNMFLLLITGEEL